MTERLYHGLSFEGPLPAQPAPHIIYIMIKGEDYSYNGWRSRMLKEAILWGPLKDGKARCNVCSYRCVIAPGKLGHCRTRKTSMAGYSL